MDRIIIAQFPYAAKGMYHGKQDIAFPLQVLIIFFSAAVKGQDTGDLFLTGPDKGDLVIDRGPLCYPEFLKIFWRIEDRQHIIPLWR